MQSPLATAEPAHGAPRQPVEGAGTVLLVVMGVEEEEEGDGVRENGGAIGAAQKVKQVKVKWKQRSRKGNNCKCKRERIWK